jgi:molybdate transport system substrate-binding protein
VNAAWTKESGKSAMISYAASPVLAKQIEEGAPADVFISADLDWMDYLAERKRIKPEIRFNLLGNRLVLIVPKDSVLEAKIEPGFSLASLLGDGRLAMANTDSVPAGKYGNASLQALGVWDQVKDKIAQAENVRAALLLVSRGEAPLGIVYTTDAKADPKVKVLGTFPDDTHPPIIYPVAVLAQAKSADAQAFVNYLKTNAAKSLFEAQGFEVLSAP